MQFEYQINLKKSAFLTDHRVCTRAILPATAYLEMALAAGNKVFKLHAFAIENFVIHQALIIPEDKLIALQIKIYKKEDNLFYWKIYSLEKDCSDLKAITTLHASGKVVINESKQQLFQVDLANKLTSHDQISVSNFYQTCQERNIEYGDRFQVLEKLYRQKNCALGQVRLGGNLLSERDDYLLHPVVLDSCLQVLWAALPEFTKEDTYLPVGVGNLIVHRYPDLNFNLWSYAQVRSRTEPGQKILEEYV